jgi:1-phosphofructokinase
MTTDHSIITVTLNPAIDQTVFVEALVPGSVHRVRESHRQAGGKGINVGTMLALGGAQVVVSGLLGDANPSIFESHFKTYGLQDAFTRIHGETRTGIKIVDLKANENTDINLPGPAPTPGQLEALVDNLLQLVRPGGWVVIAGSLPPGVTPDFFGKLIQRLREAGARIAVDSSGAALAAAVEVGVDLAKPNAFELSELLGRELNDFESIVSAAQELRRERVPNLVVSLGSHGALFLTNEAELIASAPAVKVVSTVGAGDSLLAGYLQGRLLGESTAACARRASVYAWSCLESLTRTLPDPETLTQRLSSILVQPIDTCGLKG